MLCAAEVKRPGLLDILGDVLVVVEVNAGRVPVGDRQESLVGGLLWWSDSHAELDLLAETAAEGVRDRSA